MLFNLLTNRLSQEETEDISLSDRLGVFSSGVGFIASWLAFAELKEEVDLPLPEDLDQSESNLEPQEKPGERKDTGVSDQFVWLLVFLVFYISFGPFNKREEKKEEGSD
ncbi:hypothetical protein Halha_1437 [Halobacteroides halobius DSM 5150]|uniref:Uncharacterized protein n=1 Tax=Halobacteroides halobius (strain ATCC 35273 / DSM 5150 / MD-1) TaxID=748449 RepID=L0K7Z1_HALHC|nr:hypothetical protein [Halobacteroides halobius]AGB41382.1 hypothetical protein Halha_1437 [Halobacteroides halobius DSM 5150]